MGQFLIDTHRKSGSRDARLLRERVELAVQMISSRVALAESRALLARLAGKPVNDSWSWARACSATPTLSENDVR
jgi:hypothetical protein